MSAKNIDDQDFENQSNDTDSSYDESYEDDAAYSEDDADQWSDDADLSDEEDMEAAQPAPKKKSSNLMIGVILFVIIIAVFGFMALSGNQKTAPETMHEAQTAINAEAESDNVATPAPDATQSQTSGITDLKTQEDQSATGDQSANVPAPAPAPVGATPQQGLMDNPDLMGQNSSGHNGVEQAPGTATQAENAPVPTLATEPTPDAEPVAQPTSPSKDVVATIAPSVKPVSDFPTVDSIKKPDATAPEISPPVTATETVPAVTASVRDDKSAGLQTQLTVAQKTISDLKKQLSDQAAELAAQKQKAPSAASDDSNKAEVADLKAKISELEARLAEKPTAKPVKVVAERDEPTYETERSVEQPSVAPVKKAPIIAAKPKIVAQQWSLKSAGTGKAILSNKTTGDLKTVRVGDTVPGLGRILSISSSNSSWVVKGTTGSVSE